MIFLISVTQDEVVISLYYLPEILCSDLSPHPFFMQVNWFYAKLTGGITVHTVQVARDLVFNGGDGLGVNGVGLTCAALVRFIALQGTQNLLLDNCYPLISLLLTWCLKVPLFVVQRHKAELIPIRVWRGIDYKLRNKNTVQCIFFPSFYGV